MKHFIVLMLLLALGCKKKSAELTRQTAPYPQKQIVMEGLNRPWSIAFLNEHEALVTEKNGTLVRVHLDQKSKKNIAGFPTDLVDSIGALNFGDNSGIFEILLHPDFATNRTIYLSYAAKHINHGKATKFIRATLTNDSLSGIKTILEAGPYSHENFHYGGGMTIGADMKLYLSTGERLFWEHDEPPLPIAQDVSDPRGKIHRFNLDGSIPNDNPNLGNGAIPSIVALGIRNTQGLALQPETGLLWFSEHGTIQGDELNILDLGANYGWPNSTTGRLRSTDYKPPKIEGAVFAQPAWFWQHTVAPTGLCFYTGHEFPNWKNNLFVPGLSQGSLWRFHIVNRTIKSAEELFLDERVRTRKVAQSPEGKIYILTDEENGKIIRILPNQ